MREAGTPCLPVEEKMSPLFVWLILVLSITPNLENNIISNAKETLSVFQSSQVYTTRALKNTLSPQRAEDTLIIDDGNAVDYALDKYVAQKFSTGVLCSLKSFIWRTSMEYTECSLYVWSDSNGMPQSSNNLVPPFYFYSAFPKEWERMDLSVPIVVDKDFWIGIYNLGAASSFYYDWTPNCHKRVADSPDKMDWSIWDYHAFGEFLVRPIVNLTGPRHDVTCTTIFSKKGFFLSNPAYDTVGIVFKNFGNVTEYNVPVYLRVKDTLGLLIFFGIKSIDSIVHNEVDTIYVSWNYNQDGDYFIEGYPYLANDCVKDNDRQEIESYIRTYPCQLYYDNLGVTMSTTRIDTVANKFFPPYYPCKIESIRVCFSSWQIGTTFTYGIGIAILDDDGPGGLPGAEIAKDSVLGLGNGIVQWLTFDFSAQNVVFDSAAFYAQWVRIPDSTTPYYDPELWTDDNPPFAMMTWVKRDTTGIWYHWQAHADALIRVCVDYPSAVYEKREVTNFRNYLSVNPTITKGRFKCSFCTEKDERIEISLYSIDGRKVKSLFSNFVKKGLHYFYPDIGNLPEGVYFVQMKDKGFRRTKKIILLK